MKAGAWPGFVIAGLLSIALPAQSRPAKASKAAGLKPSEHRAGPHGLEGWTLQGPIPNDPQGKYPFFLVIARNGREIRRFGGEAFVWKWMFAADGRQVAYEAGPLHFGLACILTDIKTGKEQARYDCYRDLPDDVPDWVSALEDLP